MEVRTSGSFDTASSWCIVKALSLTSITSVTLLDAWTTPCIVLLTALLFGTRCALLTLCVVLKTIVVADDSEWRTRH